MGPQESIQSYGALFESTTVRVWHVDLECRILRISRAVSSDVGLSPEDFVGEPMYRFAPPEVAARLVVEDMEIMRSGTPRLDVVKRYPTVSVGGGWFRVDKIPCRGNGGKSRVC